MKQQQKKIFSVTRSLYPERKSQIHKFILSYGPAQCSCWSQLILYKTFIVWLKRRKHVYGFKSPLCSFPVTCIEQVACCQNRRFVGPLYRWGVRWVQLLHSGFLCDTRQTTLEQLFQIFRCLMMKNGALLDFPKHPRALLFQTFLEVYSSSLKQGNMFLPHKCATWI